MKPAVFDMVQKMDINDIELQLVLQCAPVIAGIKISNLLMIRTENVFLALDILKNSHFCYFLLRKDIDKTAILLYHPEKLKEYLQQERVTALLRQMGYVDCTIGQVLSVFRVRYLNYMEHMEKFPHEMGVLLGYPVEDVIGFLKNEGRNFLYTGYWKVYENLAEKISLFRSYELAKEQQVQMIAQGIKMSEIIRWYEAVAKRVCSM